MTANELFQAASALYGETDTTDEDNRALAVPQINMLLAETHEVNNRMREQAGKEVLKDIPSIATLDEEIPYETKLVRLALPYGLAAMLYFGEEDNDGRLSMFKQEYAERVNQCDRWVVAF